MELWSVLSHAPSELISSTAADDPGSVLPGSPGGSVRSFIRWAAPRIDVRDSDGG